MVKHKFQFDLSSKPAFWSTDNTRFSVARHWWHPLDFEKSSPPIMEAKVSAAEKPLDDSIPLMDREIFELERPEWILAAIKPGDISRDDIAVDDHLSTVILSRGNTSSDEYHFMLSPSFGGKAVNFNMYPGNRPESGEHDTIMLQRGLDMAMSLWLGTRQNATVIYQMRLIYESREHPDRPTNAIYLVEFIADDEEVNSEPDSTLENTQFIPNDNEQVERSGECGNGNSGEGSLEEMDNSVGNLEEIEWQSDVLSNLDEGSETTSSDGDEYSDCFECPVQIWKSCLAEGSSSEDNADVKCVRINYDFLYNYFEELVSCCVLPPPDVPVNNVQWSIWDCVPIVGSIRSLYDASKAAEIGDNTGFWVNSAIGIGGLAIDFCTLGVGGIAMQGALKTAAKVGVKGVSKSLAIAAVKGAAKQAVISASVGAAVGGAIGGKEGAIKGAVSGGIGGAIGGGLGGGTKCALKASEKVMAAKMMKMGMKAAAKAAARSVKKQMHEEFKRRPLQAIKLVKGS